MAHSSYPSASDLQTYLVGTGLVSSTVAATLSLSDKAAAASAAWEDATGWLPFLAGSASSRRFDPPGPNHGGAPSVTMLNRGGGTRLYLEGGLAAEPSAVVVGYTDSDPGTTLTAGTHYWLAPYNALAQGRPYRWLEFVSPQWGSARSVRVTGQFGWGLTIPDDAWMAVLQQGALLSAVDLAGQISGGLISWSEEASETYGADPLGKFVERWQKTWDRAVSRYQRMVL